MSCIIWQLCLFIKSTLHLNSLPLIHSSHRQKHDIGRLERIVRGKKNASMIHTAFKCRSRWTTNSEMPLKHVVFQWIGEVPRGRMRLQLPHIGLNSFHRRIAAIHHFRWIELVFRYQNVWIIFELEQHTNAINGLIFIVERKWKRGILANEHTFNIILISPKNICNARFFMRCCQFKQMTRKMLVSFNIRIEHILLSTNKTHRSRKTQ